MFGNPSTARTNGNIDRIRIFVHAHHQDALMRAKLLSFLVDVGRVFLYLDGDHANRIMNTGFFPTKCLRFQRSSVRIPRHFDETLVHTVLSFYQFLPNMKRLL